MKSKHFIFQMNKFWHCLCSNALTVSSFSCELFTRYYFFTNTQKTFCDLAKVEYHSFRIPFGIVCTASFLFSRTDWIFYSFFFFANDEKVNQEKAVKLSEFLRIALTRMILFSFSLEKRKKNVFRSRVAHTHEKYFLFWINSLWMA